MVFFIIFTTFTTIPAFAENPTPYNEWDFDFGEIEVSQNPDNLKEMVISVPIKYKGEMLNGTANVSANVTNPNGKSIVHHDSTLILEIGEYTTLKLTHLMNHDGLYNIEIKATPPEKPYLDHVFDSETLTFLVKPNGREKDVGTLSTDSNEMISYRLKNSTSVKYNEMVHAVITLPEAHTFEKITLTNEDKLVKEFSVDTKDIYMKPSSHYENMKVNLVKSDNLLPSADGQDTLHEYVVFYVNPKEMCDSVYCVNIDLVEEEPSEFPLVPVVIGVASVVGALIIIKYLKSKDNKSQPNKPQHNKKQDHKTEDYIYNTRNPM